MSGTRQAGRGILAGMPRSAFVLLLPLLSLLTLSLATLRGEQDFVWEQDLGAARARAAAEGKPLLLLLRCQP